MNARISFGQPSQKAIFGSDTMGEENKLRANSTRILIADDHPIFRYALRTLLSLEDDFDVVGEAADGREALDKVQKLDPDLLLLDLWMPNLDGLSTLQAMAELHKRTKVIVMTAYDDKSAFVKAMKLGCCGIVRKPAPPELIIKSIRKILSGEILRDSHTTAAILQCFGAPAERGGSAVPGQGGQDSQLTAREREIVVLLTHGYKNSELAEKMSISEQTVKNHMHNIFDKLGVSDRLELILYAINKSLHLNGEPR